MNLSLALCLKWRPEPYTVPATAVRRTERHWTHVVSGYRIIEYSSQPKAAVMHSTTLLPSRRGVSETGLDEAIVRTGSLGWLHCWL